MSSGARRWVGPSVFAALTAVLAWAIAHDFDVRKRWVAPVDYIA